MLPWQVVPLSWSSRAAVHVRPLSSLCASAWFWSGLGLPARMNREMVPLLEGQVFDVRNAATCVTCGTWVTHV